MKWNSKDSIWEVQSRDISKYRGLLRDLSRKFNVPVPKLKIDESDGIPVYDWSSETIIVHKHWDTTTELSKTIKHEFYHHLEKYKKVHGREVEAEKFGSGARGELDKLLKG